jgi:ATP-dependent Clp protease ATP-binding subunit ClpC
VFERYTENARRTIFFSRYEAATLASPLIESGHLLLGMLRESKTVADCVRGIIQLPEVDSDCEDLRTAILVKMPQHAEKSTPKDLPLSNECKRILAYAAEEADRLRHKHIGVDHLLLGILREENSFAAGFLRLKGLERNKLRETLREAQVQDPSPDAFAGESAPRKQIVNPRVIPNPPQPRQSWLSRLLRRFGKAE